jgi:eukaryotic-like serine/threonine-protein kinase
MPANGHSTPIGQKRQQRKELQLRELLLANVHNYLENISRHALNSLLPVEIIVDDCPDSSWPGHYDIRRRQSEPGLCIVERLKLLEIAPTLLLFGGIGSGKTASLIALSRYLLEQARISPAASLPVHLNMSFWPIRKQTFAEWLVGELFEEFQLPRDLARSWIQKDTFTLLLDGWDELQEDYRTAAVAALNEFKHAHPLTTMVITCRSDNNIFLRQSLKHHAAAQLRPLTTPQIQAVLQGEGAKFEHLTRMLHTDAELGEILASPLMLWLLVEGYRNPESKVDDPEIHGQAARTLIFRQYIERKPSDPRSRSSYPQEKAKRWLSWLAYNMRGYNERFFFETMQPSLLKERDRPTYTMLVGALVGMFFAGILAMPISWGPGLWPWLWRINCLVVGIAGVAVWLSWREIKPIEQLHWHQLWTRIKESIGSGVVHLFREIRRYWKSRRLWIKLTGTVIAVTVLWHLVVAFNNGSKQAIDLDRLILLALCGVTIIVLLTYLWPEIGFLISFLLLISIVTLVATFLGPFWLFKGLVGPFDEKNPTASRHSLFKQIINLVLCMLIGAVGSLTCIELFGCIASGFELLQYRSPHFRFVHAAIMAAQLGAALGGAFGLTPIAQHFVLRLILWRRGDIPFRYSRFLQYAVRMGILMKAGRGFIFIHNSLKEYFAASSPGKIPGQVGVGGRVYPRD